MRLGILGKSSNFWRSSPIFPLQILGLQEGRFIPYDLFKRLLELFGNDHVNDVDEEISMLRAVKSNDEIEVIRYAYKIADHGMDTVYNNLREGISERALAAEAEYAMRKMGSEGLGIELMINQVR